MVALVFGSRFSARSLGESDPESARRRRAGEHFQTHYAQEGLIVSKCVCMEVKRLADIRFTLLATVLW
jgi:hypothetical protein